MNKKYRQLKLTGGDEIICEVIDETDYEIVLGGWNNTKSVIRENNIEMYHLIKTGIADGMVENNFKRLLVYLHGMIN